MGSRVLGRYMSLVRMVFCGNLRARHVRKWVRDVEISVPVQRAGVGRVRDTVAIVQRLGLQILTVVIAVPPACRYPCRLQTSYVIPAVIAGQQGSRVVRWRAASGGCCADATILGEGATD